MEIYPKLCENLKGLDVVDEYIKKSKGVEIQLMEINFDNYQINAENPIKILTEKYNLEEITIHLPIKFCYIEYFFVRDEEIFYNMFNHFIELSNKYNIKIDVLFHTNWDLETHKNTTIEKFEKLLKYIENTKVSILLENVVLTTMECYPIKLAEYINHAKLKVCIDLCHVKCKSVIYKTPINEFFEIYIPKNAKNFVKQIHFSNNKNNDGYIDKSTHSQPHDMDENFINDVNLLIKYGLISKNIVTEINEEDYNLRPNQVKEIKLLEKVEKLLISKNKDI